MMEESLSSSPSHKRLRYRVKMCAKENEEGRTAPVYLDARPCWRGGMQAGCRRDAARTEWLLVLSLTPVCLLVRENKRLVWFAAQRRRRVTFFLVAADMRKVLELKPQLENNGGKDCWRKRRA